MANPLRLMCETYRILHAHFTYISAFLLKFSVKRHSFLKNINLSLQQASKPKIIVL